MSRILEEPSSLEGEYEAAEPWEGDALDSDVDLQIDDESLIEAATASSPARVRARSETRSFSAALLLALLVHGAIGGLCFALALTSGLWQPRVEFTQGAASAQSGLVSDDANPAAPPSAGLPAPPLPMPQPQQSQALDPLPTSDDAQADPPVQLGSSLDDTLAAQDSEAPDPLAIGVTGNPIGPAPHWRRAAASAEPAHAVTAPPAGTGAAVASARQKGGSARHSFTPARGAGYAGAGRDGSGLDSRGLPVPQYPDESRRRHEQGTVELEVLVRADGSVGNVRVAKGSGFSRLDQAALGAVRSARFTPALQDGTPVSCPILVPFCFVLR